MSRVTDYLREVWSKSLDRWWDEIRKAFEAFADQLLETWFPRYAKSRRIRDAVRDMLDLMRDVVRGIRGDEEAIGKVALRFTRTLDAILELRQDIFLAIPRAVAPVLVETFPLPKYFGNYVCTLETVARANVAELLQGAIDVVDADMPAEIDMLIRLKAWIERWRLWKVFSRARLVVALKAKIILMIIEFLWLLLRLAAAMWLVVWAGWFVFRVNDPLFSKRWVKRLALPQDSRRSVVIRPGQRRRNIRPGPDQ